jgi:hypothetical protein
MYEQIITNTQYTGKEQDIYNALLCYTQKELKGLPTIKIANTEAEPFDTVEQFNKVVESGKVTIWGRHFRTQHEYLTPEQFGQMRAVHDVHGHLATWKETGGAMGNFTFNGEIESLFLVAKDTQSPLIVEGLILETVQRNLQSEVVFNPFANVITEQMALDIIRLTA